MKALTIEQKKAWVFGLLIDCPFGKALDGCPAKEARALSVWARVDLIRLMGEVKMDMIINHHQKCLCKREIR